MIIIIESYCISSFDAYFKKHKKIQEEDIISLNKANEFFTNRQRSLKNQQYLTYKIKLFKYEQKQINQSPNQHEIKTKLIINNLSTIQNDSCENSNKPKFNEYDYTNELITFKMLKTPMRNSNQPNIFKNEINNDIMNSKGQAIEFSDSEKINNKISKTNNDNIVDDLLKKYENDEYGIVNSSNQKTMYSKSEIKKNSNLNNSQQNIRPNLNDNEKFIDKIDRAKSNDNSSSKKSTDVMKKQLKTYKSEFNNIIQTNILQESNIQKAEGIITSISNSLKLDMNNKFIKDIILVKTNYQITLIYLNSIFIFRNSTVIGKINTMDSNPLIKLMYCNKDLQILIVSNINNINTRIEVFSVNEQSKLYSHDFLFLNQSQIESFDNKQILLRSKMNIDIQDKPKNNDKLNDDTNCLLIDQHNKRDLIIPSNIKNLDRRSVTEKTCEKYFKASRENISYIIISGQILDNNLQLQHREMGSYRFRLSMYKIDGSNLKPMNLNSLTLVKCEQMQLKQKQQNNQLIKFSNTGIYVYCQNQSFEKETICAQDQNLTKIDYHILNFGMNQFSIEYFDDKWLIIKYEKGGVNRFNCYTLVSGIQDQAVVKYGISKENLLNVSGQLQLIDKNQFLSNE